MIHPRKATRGNWPEFQPTDQKIFSDNVNGLVILMEVENSNKQLAWRLTATRAEGKDLDDLESVVGPVRKDYAGIYRLNAFGLTYCWCTNYWSGYYPVEQPFLEQITLLEPLP